MAERILRINYTVIDCCDKVIHGHHNIITGNRNIIFGYNNKIVGDHNRIAGDDNHAIGDNNTARAGARNIIESVDNELVIRVKNLSIHD